MKAKLARLFIRFMDVFVPVVPGNNGDDGGGNLATSNTDMSQFHNGLSDFLNRYRGLVMGVFGVVSISLLGLFIAFLIELGNAGDNPQKRKDVTSKLLMCGIAFAIMGSITLFFGLFFFAFAEN